MKFTLIIATIERVRKFGNTDARLSPIVVSSGAPATDSLG